MKKLMLALASLGLFALGACQEQGVGFEEEPVGEEGAFGEGAADVEQDTQGVFDEMQQDTEELGDDSIGAEEDVGAEDDLGADDSIGAEEGIGEEDSAVEEPAAPEASE